MDAGRWYVGVDWGSETHQWCVIDGDGRVVGERTVPHTALAVHEALQWVHVTTGAPAADIVVGIETPHGALVDTFLEHGHPVYALNPKQLDRFRDRFSAGGAKDDRRDARVLADALRTDRRAFRAVRADDPAIIQLRELSRLLDDLQVDEGRLTNQLREQLYRVHAAWLTLVPGANEPWLWRLLHQSPHPDTWRHVARRQITATLRAHHIRQLTSDDVIAALRSPRLQVAPGVADAVAIRLTALIPQVIVIH